MASSLGRLKSAIFDKEERKMQYQSHIRGLNAYDRHKKFMNDHVRFYGYGNNADHSLPIKTDKDTLREGYRFILSEEDDMDSTWEKRLVKRYYDKLFKEYCIADMSRYKKGKVQCYDSIAISANHSCLLLDWIEMANRKGGDIWKRAVYLRQ